MSAAKRRTAKLPLGAKKSTRRESLAEKIAHELMTCSYLKTRCDRLALMHREKTKDGTLPERELCGMNFETVVSQITNVLEAEGVPQSQI